jgi:hypothetical protein
MFGVEAASPGRRGKNNFEVQLVCRDMGFTPMEGLANLDRVVGRETGASPTGSSGARSDDQHGRKTAFLGGPL